MSLKTLTAPIPPAATPMLIAATVAVPNDVAATADDNVFMYTVDDNGDITYSSDNKKKNSPYGMGAGTDLLPNASTSGIKKVETLNGNPVFISDKVILNI